MANIQYRGKIQVHPQVPERHRRHRAQFHNAVKTAAPRQRSGRRQIQAQGSGAHNPAPLLVHGNDGMVAAELPQRFRQAAHLLHGIHIPGKQDEAGRLQTQDGRLLFRAHFMAAYADQGGEHERKKIICPAGTSWCTGDKRECRVPQSPGGRLPRGPAAPGRRLPCPLPPQWRQSPSGWSRPS